MYPKEQTKDFERHLIQIRIEIQERATFTNPETDQATTIPGRASQQEKQIVDRLLYEVTSWHEMTSSIQREMKEIKDRMDTMKKKLSELQSTRGLTNDSAEYAVDDIFCQNVVSIGKSTMGNA
jgi:acetyl-CoA carboxylase alpha subunit